jgi:Domain of unknown function (DUF5615)
LRLLLDEHLSPAIAEQLDRRGHDVVTAADAGLAGFDDAQVLSAATRDRRAVVTNNIRDFRPLHAAYLTMNSVHYGIVLVPASKYSLAREQLGPLITALDNLLVQFPTGDALRDTEYFL